MSEQGACRCVEPKLEQARLVRRWQTSTSVPTTVSHRDNRGKYIIYEKSKCLHKFITYIQGSTVGPGAAKSVETKLCLRQPKNGETSIQCALKIQEKLIEEEMKIYVNISPFARISGLNHRMECHVELVITERVGLYTNTFKTSPSSVNPIRATKLFLVTEQKDENDALTSAEQGSKPGVCPRCDAQTETRLKPCTARDRDAQTQ